MLVGRYRLGGITMVIENLSENLIKQGIDVTIGALSFESRPLKNELITEKISLNPLKSAKQITRYDIIHTHHSSVNVFTLLSKKPFIYQYHGTSTQGYKKNFYKIMQYKKFRDRVTKILVISDEAREHYTQQYDSNKVLPFKNGVDINKFKPNLTNKFRKGDPQFLFVGNLYPYKNVGEIIRCVSDIRKTHPNTVLQVIGDGKDFKHLQKLISEIGVEKNVELLGRISDDLEYYYSACDVYISASKFETCPLTPLEAMACGKPVLLSNIEAHVDTVETSKAGLVYESGNLIDMGEKLIYLYKNKDSYYDNSIKYANENSWEKISLMLSNYYSAVLNQI